jgi:hypothetical protein
MQGGSSYVACFRKSSQIETDSSPCSSLQFHEIVFANPLLILAVARSQIHRHKKSLDGVDEMIIDEIITRGRTMIRGEPRRTQSTSLSRSSATSASSDSSGHAESLLHRPLAFQREIDALF